MTEVGFLLGLEPEKAIEFLQAKKAGISKIAHKGLLDSAMARATTIANLSNLEMTNDIYQSLIDAQSKGQSFDSWKKDIFAHFKKKGWIAGYDKGYLLADPKTGEYFGTPRRLETIYRTNMQAAYSAQRYQQQRDNVDSRPYWQYSAVNDSRTRPSHSAMDGLIYRYDDPFWSVFYPPNGFNCRCSVIALAERDIQRQHFVVGSSDERLVEFVRPNGKGEKTTAFKLAEETYLTADKGFDYNVGRIAYKPNLDRYPEKLAHQFVKREMSGEGFKFDFTQLEKDFSPYLAEYKSIKGKKEREDFLKPIRDKFRMEYKFTAGVLSKETKTEINTALSTVWLSDDTLIKQIANRYGQDFDFDDYALLPDVLYTPDKIEPDGINHFRFYKQIDSRRFVAVIKVLNEVGEIYLTSQRLVSEKQWRKVFK